MFIIDACAEHHKCCHDRLVFITPSARRCLQHVSRDAGRRAVRFRQLELVYRVEMITLLSSKLLIGHGSNT